MMDRSKITATEAVTRGAEEHSIRAAGPLPLILLALGTLLIAASFFPIGKLASEALWTAEDSAAYDQVASRYKRSAYQSAARSGVSLQQWKAQRERMKQELDAMHDRLERALTQPRLWSQWLLGLGVLLAGCGAIWLRR